MRSREVRRIVSSALALTVVLAVFGFARAADPSVQIRQRYFGIENVDAVTGTVRPDRVILSWFGVTNFAAAIGGHVLILDAWIPRGEYSGYVPVSIPDLVALDPEYVFLGHGHFDHAADSAPIVTGSGATLVSTPEHCDQAQRQAGDTPITCIAAVPRGAAFGATTDLSTLMPGIGITAVKHVHSAAEPPDPSDPHTPAVPQPDANAVVQHLPAPQDTVHLLSHLGDAEGGTVLYQFRVGNFSLTWHDSSGPLKEVAPGVLSTLAALPPTDVQIGAIMGFNQITNGLRDPRMYIEAIKPKIFVPSHHDNWAPGVSTRGEHYKPFVEDELAKIPAAYRPILRFISDPQDYVRPEVLTFDIEAPVWR